MTSFIEKSAFAIIPFLLACSGCVLIDGVECREDQECSDGVFCNGEELCEDGVCFVGDAPCGCDCIEELDACGECCHDADCDDGFFCNGTETCVDFACVAGDPPCARGGLSCDGNCFEDTNECISPCATDADCDDGQFCNGEEVCDPCGSCQSVNPPCDEAECDELNDVCLDNP